MWHSERHFLVIASIFFVKLEAKSSAETSMVQEVLLVWGKRERVRRPPGRGRYRMIPWCESPWSLWPQMERPPSLWLCLSRQLKACTVASLAAQLVKNPPAAQKTPVWFLGQKDPLEKGWATCSSVLGLPWWLRRLRICLQCGRPGFDPWFGKIPWRSLWQLTPVFFPGESHGQRSLAGYSPWGCRVGHDWAN